MSKSLILFYSLEGDTRKASEYLSKQLDIPYEEIKPVKDIKTKGFMKYLLGGAQVIRKKKPELLPIKSNLEEYDTIFLGTPIWAGTFTPSIKTLLEDGILKDKNIALFYCNKGGADKVDKDIQEAAKINNKLKSTYNLTGVKNGFESLKGDFLKWAKENQ